MAITIDENSVVTYDNENVERELLANIKPPQYWADKAKEYKEAAEDAAEDAMTATPEGYSDFVDSVADTYSSASTYSEGDYCLHESTLYRANQDIATAEEWTAAHWTQAVLANEVTDLKEDLNASVNNTIITNVCEANPVFATGAHTNIIDLPTDEDSDYSSIVSYTPFGFTPHVGSGQMYYFTPNWVNGTTYTLYIHYFGDWYTGATVYSNIRVFRGTTLISGNYYGEGENTATFTFTSDGTEKIRFYVWNKDVYKVISVIAIAKVNSFSSSFSSLLATAIGDNLKYGGHINSSNYSTLISDLNNCPVNTFYTGFTGNASYLPANCPASITVPFTVKTYGTDGYIVFQEFAIYSNISSLGTYTSGNTWVRCLTGTVGNRVAYYNWISKDTQQSAQITSIASRVRPVITVDASATADETNLIYTNFYKAMEYAYNNGYDVEVKAGTYDIVDDYIDYKGQSTFDAIANSWYGTPIGNGMTVRCDAEAYFTCNITSAKSSNYLTVGLWFAPMLPLDGGFRLEGWNCSATNSRYVLHDGGYNNSDVFCNHEIINCQMYLDNTELATYNQCIGGGLLSGGIHVIIKDCIFESVGIADGSGAVTYHNVSDTTEGATSYNTYDISGCYCRTGTVQARKHGTETPVSPFRVHDNFLRANPQISFESESDTINNMELLAWGNTITAS